MHSVQSFEIVMILHMRKVQTTSTLGIVANNNFFCMTKRNAHKQIEDTFLTVAVANAAAAVSAAALSSLYKYIDTYTCTEREREREIYAALLM